jgi:hypothetical protein
MIGRILGGIWLERVGSRRSVPGGLRVLRTVAQFLVASVMCPFLLLAACAVSLGGRRRNPRLVWGPTPIINIKYLSQAAKLYGYQSQTVVYTIYPANRREDFDLVIDDFVPRVRILGVNPLKLIGLGCYVVFIWALFTHDIFHFFYDGGFLSPTPLRFLECQLLQLAGKKVVMIPYGSDVAIVSNMKEHDRQMWLREYPRAAERDAVVRKQVLYFTRRADFVIACDNQTRWFQPRQDLLLFSYMAIDTDSWSPDGNYSAADGRTGEVVVLHTPNHRAIKGTQYLIEAVERLRQNGLKVRLEILEGRPNDEVKAALQKADILAEQFFGGYGLSGIEGMTLGKPVLSNLSRHPREIIERTSLKECPVMVTPVEKIEDNLRLLVEDPELRRSLGRAGRLYVEKYHSLRAIGGILNDIYRKVWLGEKVDFGWLGQA